MNSVLQCTAAQTGAIVEQPIPEPPATGAVLKVVNCGVCHSDAHIFKGDLKPMPPFPIVLGHEVAGIIHSLGNDPSEGSEPLGVGDRVVLHAWGGCRKCWVCRSGSHNCPNRSGPDGHAYGVFLPGGFQKYVSVKSLWCLVKLPEEIPFDVGCLAPCSALTAFHALAEVEAAVKYAIAGKGVANVLFVGAGGLSLWATEMIKAIYQDNVQLLVVDLQEEKLTDAQTQGADKTVCWNKDDTAETRSAVILDAIGDRVDAVIDFVSMTSTVEAAYQTLALNATYALVGIFGGTMPPLPLMRMSLGNIRVQGVYTGSKAQLVDLFKLWLDKKLKGPPISRIALGDANAVMTDMLEGRITKGRAVIGFD